MIAMNDTFFYFLCVVFLAGACIGTLTACGASASTVARTTINVAAAAGNEADKLEQPAYMGRAATCLEVSETLEAYTTCMAEHDALLLSLVVLHGSLEIAEHVVDSVDAGGTGTVYDGLACVSVALEDVMRLLRNVHIPIPGEIDSALRLLRALVLGPCGQ